VLLLGKGGHTVYLGPTKDNAPQKYFEGLGFDKAANMNPAGTPGPNMNQLFSLFTGKHSVCASLFSACL
jgi:hypothetical protein